MSEPEDHYCAHCGLLLVRHKDIVVIHVEEVEPDQWAVLTFHEHCAILAGVAGGSRN